MTVDPKHNLPPSLRDAMGTRDTGEVRKPGLPVLKTSDPQINAWAAKIKEIVDVQSGAAGNKWEKLVTVRDIKDVATIASVLQAQPAEAKPGDIQISIGGGVTATVAVDRFVESILNHPLYKDLQRRLDDPRRFDNLPQEVREIVLKSIADEALVRGADIQDIRIKQQSLERSLAIWGRETTAAVEAASAGVRNLEWATAETNFAQAGKITQLGVSLGNFYQDGTPGRANLEQQMTVTADRVNGLHSQWTIKTQAGGVVAGIGVAASSNAAGVSDSAVLIQAGKFAVVMPDYVPPTKTVYVLDEYGQMILDPATGQWMTTNQVIVEDIPVNKGGVPFGVDANGIYLNNNVYIKGNIRVDTGGRRLVDGLRGSLALSPGVAPGTAWSDTIARQAVWGALGNPGSAVNNNHLVIGDMVTIGATTKQWIGSYWDIPGAVFNGNMVVDGTIAATKIDTRGLDIRDASGNVIFSSGVPLNASRISGLGDLAWLDDVYLGGTLWSNGTPVVENQFATVHNPIRPENVSSFLSGAIIDTAYIKFNAVETLQVRGGSVTTVQQTNLSSIVNLAPGASQNIMNVNVWVPDNDISGYSIVVLVNGLPLAGDGGLGLTITDTVHGALAYTGTSFRNGNRGVAYNAATYKLSPGWHGVYVVAQNLDPSTTFQLLSGSNIIFGGLR